MRRTLVRLLCDNYATKGTNARNNCFSPLLARALKSFTLQPPPSGPFATTVALRTMCTLCSVHVPGYAALHILQINYFYLNNNNDNNN